jgi:hypothetical protein
MLRALPSRASQRSTPGRPMYARWLPRRCPARVVPKAAVRMTAAEFLRLRAKRYSNDAAALLAMDQIIGVTRWAMYQAIADELRSAADAVEAL